MTHSADENAAQRRAKAPLKRTAAQVPIDNQLSDQKKVSYIVQYDANGRRIPTNTPIFQDRRKKQKRQRMQTEQTNQKREAFRSASDKKVPILLHTNSNTNNNCEHSAKKTSAKKSYEHVTPRYLSHFHTKEEVSTAPVPKKEQTSVSVKQKREESNAIALKAPPLSEKKDILMENQSSDRAKNELIDLEKIQDIRREIVEGPQILKTFMKTSTPRLGRQMRAERKSANDPKSLTFSSSDSEEEFDFYHEKLRRRKRLDRMVLGGAKSEEDIAKEASLRNILTRRWHRLRTIRPKRYVYWSLYFLLCIYCCMLVIPTCIQMHAGKSSICFDSKHTTPNAPAYITSAVGSLSNDSVRRMNKLFCKFGIGCEVFDIPTESSDYGGESTRNYIPEETCQIVETIVRKNTDAVCGGSDYFNIIPYYQQAFSISNMTESCVSAAIMHSTHVADIGLQSSKLLRALSLAILQLPGTHMQLEQDTLYVPFFWVTFPCWAKLTFLSTILPALGALLTIYVAIHLLHQWAIRNADLKLIRQLSEDLHRIKNSLTFDNEHSKKNKLHLLDDGESALVMLKQLYTLEYLSNIDQQYIQTKLLPQCLQETSQILA